MFRQTDGVAKPFLANIFVGYYVNSLPMIIVSRLRITLMMFLILKNNVIFFTLLTKMHKCIVFTVEEEISGKINFLDINIIKNRNKTFSTSVYRK